MWAHRISEVVGSELVKSDLTEMESDVRGSGLLDGPARDRFRPRAGDRLCRGAS